MEIKVDYPINIDVLNTIIEMGENYEVIAAYRIIDDGKRIYLEDKQSETCRFCGKSFPEVTFKKFAHTISNFTGNLTLFSKYECDTCNSVFSEFETAMANFMLPNHTLSSQKGKKKRIPKYKQSGNPTINSDNNGISISNVNPLMAERFTDEKGCLNFNIPSFIPDLVYRCLVKMALSIIPENKLANYQKTIKWLKDKNMLSNIQQKALLTIYPLNMILPDIHCVCLEKKDNANLDIISTVFFLSYGNFAFQTYLPHYDKEIANEGVKLKAFPFAFPANFDLDERNRGCRQEYIIDLSSKQKETTAQLILELQYKGIRKTINIK